MQAILGASLKGRVLGPFWSENGYTLCPFWSGIRYGFLLAATGAYERSYRFNSKWITIKYMKFVDSKRALI